MTPNIQNPITVRGVSAFLVCGKGDDAKFLLMRRTDKKSAFWAQVAGKIEDGETAWQAALREISEETSLTPDRFFSADICEQFYEIDRDSIWISPVFVAHFDKEPEVILNEEHDRFEWLTFAQTLEHLSFAGQKHAVEVIWKEFIQSSPNPWLEIGLTEKKEADDTN